MFAFGSPLFWYKLVFATELFIIENLYTCKLKRRGRFWLRLISSTVIYFGITFLTPILWYNAAYVSAMFIFIFLVSVLLFKFCYNEPLVNLLFCGFAAYATQHIAYSLYSLIISATLLDGGASSGIYGEGGIEGRFNIYTATIYAECYVSVYIIAWFTLARKIVGNGDMYIDNVTLLWLSGLLIAVTVVLNAVIVYTEAMQTRAVQVISFIYGIISCVLALLVQFSMKKQKKLAGDIAVVEQMWHRDKEHYKISKETIKIINIKCHDLKHQIQSIRLKGKMDEEALEEIENSVLIYDSVVKTGNDALDVLLTEKSLYCEKHSIKLTCMADGEKLKFISSADIYSLFGNALDNAIEHLKQYEDKQKRFIRLTVKCAGEMLSVHIENYFEGDLKFKDGVPQTTKKDTAYHGYGMISMQAICEKYGGYMFVKASNNLFMVDMIFSIKSVDDN